MKLDFTLEAAQLVTKIIPAMRQKSEAQLLTKLSDLITKLCDLVITAVRQRVRRETRKFAKLVDLLLQGRKLSKHRRELGFAWRISCLRGSVGTMMVHPRRTNDRLTIVALPLTLAELLDGDLRDWGHAIECGVPGSIGANMCIRGDQALGASVVRARG